MTGDKDFSPAKDFSLAIAACLSYPDPPPHGLQELVAEVMHHRIGATNLTDRVALNQLQALIEHQPGASGQVALVYGGATKIKGYVFEAPKLPEIRGASALLDWINVQALRQIWYKELGKELGEACIVYAGGGNILAFAPAALGEELARRIERCYTEETLTANSAAVSAKFSLLELRYGRRPLDYWVDDFQQDWADPACRQALEDYYYDPPDESRADDGSSETLAHRFLNRKTFGECATVLATMFNRRREARATHGDTRYVPGYPLLPWTVKCDSSDVRPAVVAATVGTDQRSMSEPSARKRYIGQVVKREQAQTRWFTDAFSWRVDPDLQKDSWEQRWINYLGHDGAGSPYAAVASEQARPPKDVQEIAAASNGYIGMIYADGNNVGRLVATLETPEAYHIVAKVLDRTTRDSVFAALAKHLRPVEIGNQHVHPFEILTIGGDDLLLIVPGKQALQIALAIGRNFESYIPQALTAFKHLAHPRATDRYIGTPLPNDQPIIGLSAGVVIAQENAPIFFLDRLVNELLKRAKKLAKQRKRDYNDLGGAVDFMVLKSITMVTDDIEAFRRQALGDQNREDSLNPKPFRRMTGRPYTWHEFDGLLKTAQALKQARIPRSQLYRLRRVLDGAIHGDVTAGVLEYLYTRTRLRREQGEILQQRIEFDWQGMTGTQRIRLPPWLPSGAEDWETIWADLLEIAEMVQQEPNDGKD